MQRSSTSARDAVFSITYSEADVRRLCGAAAFKWGDSWQREGHLLNPTLGRESLSSEVGGTWRRVDLVTAAAAAGKIRTSCSCGAGEYCRHAAALLLHWLRDPASFAAHSPEEQADDDDPDLHIPAPGPRTQETPLAEFARLLDMDTMNHLRDIARMRGVRVVARNKAEMVEQLSSILGAPESVDAALAHLGEDERLTLEAADLVTAQGHAQSFEIGAAYRALGGRSEMPVGVPTSVQVLVDLGLLFPSDRWAHPSHAYIAPRVVTARLSGSVDRPDAVTRLLHAVEPGEVKDALRPQADAAPKLGMVEVFQVVAHELLQGTIGARSPAVPDSETRSVPPGWRIDPNERREVLPGRGKVVSYRQTLEQATPHRLLPLPSLLPDIDLQRLTALTGQPALMIDFAVRLMAALGVVQAATQRNKARLVAREDRLYRFLALPPHEQLTTMVTAWLAMSDSTDLRLVTGADGPLRLHYKSTVYASLAQQPKDSAVRRLLARLIGRLGGTRETWYAFASWLDLLWSLSPSLLGQASTGYTEWWFTDSRSGKNPLNLAVREDWQRVWSPLAAAILSGPMTWLGLADVAMEKNEPLAIRARPAAALLIGQDPAGRSQTIEAPYRPLVVDVDSRDGSLTVVVPAGHSYQLAGEPTDSQSSYTLLALIGELVGASPRGLTYRVTPPRLQLLFDNGMTGPDLIRRLEDRAGGSLPDAARAALEGWWKGYGAVRLYDDLTLIELGDDILLRELQVTLWNRPAEGTHKGMPLPDQDLIHVFSPRLIAVDPAKVEELIADLTRLGHTPRVIEAG